MANASGKSRPGKGGSEGGADAREARLKAALKANLARRKAQARKRDGADRDAQIDKTEKDV